MPRVRLVDYDHYRAELAARRTIRHLRRLAAQVRRTADGPRRRELYAWLVNGAWAVEELYNMHPKGER